MGLCLELLGFQLPDCLADFVRFPLVGEDLRRPLDELCVADQIFSVLTSKFIQLVIAFCFHNSIASVIINSPHPKKTVKKLCSAAMFIHPFETFKDFVQKQCSFPFGMQSVLISEPVSTVSTKGSSVTFRGAAYCQRPLKVGC